MKFNKLLIITLISLALIISGCESLFGGVKNSPYIVPNETTITTENESEETNLSANETEDINLTSNETNSNNTNECVDTDGGLVYVKKGTVISSNGKLRQVVDYCENTGKLIEYYCKEDNTLGMEIYECVNSGSYICSDGECGAPVIANTSNTSNST